MGTQYRDIRNEIERLFLCFSEVISNTSKVRRRLSNALIEIRDCYANIFERLLKATAENIKIKDRDDFLKQERFKRIIQRKKSELITIRGEMKTMRKDLNQKTALVRTFIEKNAKLSEEIEKMNCIMYDSTNSQKNHFSQGKWNDVKEKRDAPSRYNLDTDFNSNISDLHNRINLMQMQGNRKQELIQSLGRLISLEREASTKLCPHFNHESDPINVYRSSKPPQLTCDSATMTPDNFEKTDGYGFVHVSKSMSSKVLWWKAFNFARCPRCNSALGQGGSSNDTQAVEEIRKCVRDDLRRDKRKANSDAVENVGVEKEELIQSSKEFCDLGALSNLDMFISKLPFTASKMQPKSFQWLFEQMNTLYDEKHCADMADRSDGVALQSFSDFVSERMLLEYGLRRLADIHMYELFITVKRHSPRSPSVRAFASFIGFIDQEHVGLNQSSMLSAYLYARNWLSMCGTNICKTVTGNEEVCSDEDNTNKFVCSQRALRCIHFLFSDFLPQRNLNLYFRRIVSMTMVRECIDDEYKVRIPKPLSNEELQIKNVMRQTLQTEKFANRQEILNPNACKDEFIDGKDTLNFVVSFESVCSLILDILVLRYKQVTARLKRLFVEADLNGDGVLTFSEFSGILKIVNADLSLRKRLRMFRNALSSSNSSNSVALTPDVFGKVCMDYDIVSLINMKCNGDDSFRGMK